MIALIRITTALIFSLAAGMASAQSYPNRLVKIIVPYGPAGISDIAARTIGNKLAEMWKHPVVVENRAGGAGAIGTGAVAGAAPDGYTLLVATVAEFTVTPHISRQTFNVQRDLVPVIMLTDTPLMLVANPSAPFSNVRELIAYARSKGAEVPFASPGVGTLNHLTGEYFGAAIGARMVHIPYKGGGQAVAAIASGEVPMGVAGVTVVKQLIETGRLKAIGVAAEQRIKSHSEWPTMMEAGIPDFVASNWVAMAAPAGTPPDILVKINADVNKVLNMDDVRDQLARLDADPVGGPPGVLIARIRKDSERYRKIIDQIHLKVE